MTVGELLNRIDSRELPEWEAYERVAGPIGPARDDYLAALIAMTIANVNRGKSQRPYKIEQFMPRWDPEAPPEPRPEMDGREILAAVKKINRQISTGR